MAEKINERKKMRLPVHESTAKIFAQGNLSDIVSVATVEAVFTIVDKTPKINLETDNLRKKNVN